MSRKKVTAVALAAILSAGASAPLAAHAQVEDEPARVRAAAAAPAPDANVEVPPAPASPAPGVETAAPEQKRGNGFVRVITAPFRALGRLFGGGRKSPAAARRKPAEPPAEAAGAETKLAPKPETARAVEVRARNPKAPRLAFVVLPSRASMPLLAAEPAPDAPVVAAVASEPPAANAGAQPPVNLVRPDEQPRAAANPGMWIPIIEGIGRDPLAQGRALLEHGYLSEAIAELSVAASGSHNLAEANNLLGLAYDRLGDHRSAVEAYERALSVSPKDPVLLANLGYSLYLSNNFDGSLKRLRQAAKLAPQLGVIHNNLGIVQAKLGKFDESFRSFARATNEYDAHLRLAGIHEFERRDKQAIRHYEAALRLQPNTSAVLERLVALYERTGDHTKAILARRALGQPRNEQRTTTGGG